MSGGSGSEGDGMALPGRDKCSMPEVWQGFVEAHRAVNRGECRLNVLVRLGFSTASRGERLTAADVYRYGAVAHGRCSSVQVADVSQDGQRSGRGSPGRVREVPKRRGATVGLKDTAALRFPAT